MSSPQTPREPTMEEILASIRRIIAEEGQPPAKGSPGGVAPAAPPANLERRTEPNRILPAGPLAAKASPGAVLDLTDFIEDDAPREGEGLAPLASREAELAPLPEPLLPEPAPVLPPAPLALSPAAPEEKLVLLSLESERLVAEALAEVAQSVRADRPPDSAKPGSSPLEALVLEALRPSLQSWLDQNLPDLVERVLREEIRRLARRVEDADS
jgi:cell pole-organizing protein PopZ